uniref:hypothetical protein n=1 Tax=Azospirillum argentinense TaxID=2970906 RepID=UPI001FFFF2CA|nr:hypothetical protein [Azospirillum argentinense]
MVETRRAAYRPSIGRGGGAHVFIRTLSRYIGRQFVTWFLLLLGILLSIILLLDVVELLRRAGTKRTSPSGWSCAWPC